MNTTRTLPGKIKARRILADQPAGLPVARHLGRRVVVTGRLVIHGEIFFRVDFLDAPAPAVAFVPPSDVTFCR